MSKVWVPGFDQVIESAGSILFFNQNDIVFVKTKKKSTSLQLNLDQVAGSHRIFPFPMFSSTRPDFITGLARSQVDLPNRIEF